MDNKIGFVFTGQGDFAEFSESQMTIFWYQIALAKILIENGIKPDAAGGLSLGEFSAAAIAGVCAIDEMAEIVRKRTDIMNAHISNKGGGMVACVGLNVEQVEKIAKVAKVEIANLNAPKQVVASGSEKNLSIFEEKAAKLGAEKVVRLDTDGAFHSSFMTDASKEFREYLLKKKFKKPSILLYCNLTGKILDEDYVGNFAKQMCCPVRFSEMITNMVNDGVRTFYCIGPGSALINLIRLNVKETDYRVRVKQVRDVDDLRKVCGCAE